MGILNKNFLVWVEVLNITLVKLWSISIAKKNNILLNLDVQTGSRFHAFFKSEPDKPSDLTSQPASSKPFPRNTDCTLFTDEYVRHPDDVCKGRVEGGVVPVGVPALQVLLLIQNVTMNVVNVMFSQSNNSAGPHFDHKSVETFYFHQFDTWFIILGRRLTTGFILVSCHSSLKRKLYYNVK